jgi:hypothetical protein
MIVSIGDNATKHRSARRLPRVRTDRRVRSVQTDPRLAERECPTAATERDRQHSERLAVERYRRFDIPHGEDEVIDSVDLQEDLLMSSAAAEGTPASAVRALALRYWASAEELVVVRV